MVAVTVLSPVASHTVAEAEGKPRASCPEHALVSDSGVRLSATGPTALEELLLGTVELLVELPPSGSSGSKGRTEITGLSVDPIVITVLPVEPTTGGS